MRPERGKLFLDESLDPDVLQSDGIDHATRGFDQPRRLVAGHGLERQALGDEAADAVDGDNVFKFDSIAEGSTGSNDRVAQQHAGEANAHIGLHGLGGPSWRARSPPAGRDRRAQCG